MKKMNGFFSYEGSVVFSIIIFIYYLVILSSLLLLERCLCSQNDYIIGMRMASFSGMGEEYGEVIYDSKDGFVPEEYGQMRLGRGYYPIFGDPEYAVSVTEDRVIINQRRAVFMGKNDADKEILRINPIKKARRERN